MFCACGSCVCHIEVRLMPNAVGSTSSMPIMGENDRKMGVSCLIGDRRPTNWCEEWLTAMSACTVFDRSMWGDRDSGRRSWIAHIEHRSRFYLHIIRFNVHKFMHFIGKMVIIYKRSPIPDASKFEHDRLPCSIFVFAQRLIHCKNDWIELWPQRHESLSHMCVMCADKSISLSLSRHSTHNHMNETKFSIGDPRCTVNAISIKYVFG